MWRSILAVALSVFIAAESAQALPFSSAAGAPVFHIPLPSSLGYVSETYSPAFAKATAGQPALASATAGQPASASATADKPDMVLIQDLHVNRSTQFAISGILKRLKKLGLMPDAIAVEGDTGPLEVKSMQSYPDPLIRKQSADYLVQQGEMSGPMHFAVTGGEGNLFGIETDAYYQANLEMFRRSYKGREVLRDQIEKIQAVLPRLKHDAALRDRALILEQDVEAVRQLINNEVIPGELPSLLRRAGAAVEHLKLVLPKESSADIIEPLSASVNFYALALLRDEELFKNSLAVRERSRQKTTIVVAGGFHTQALAEECKHHGLSYVVITPNVKRHDKVDERLYVERLMNHHLTPEQAGTGLDWAAMQMIMISQRFVGRLWNSVTSHRAPRRGRRLLRSRTVLLGSAFLVACAIGVASCSNTPSAPSVPPSPPAPVVPPPPPVPRPVETWEPFTSVSREIIDSPIDHGVYYYGDFNLRPPDPPEGSPPPPFIKFRVTYLPVNENRSFQLRLAPLGDTSKLPKYVYDLVFIIPANGEVTIPLSGPDYGLTTEQLSHIGEVSLHSMPPQPGQPLLAPLKTERTVVTYVTNILAKSFQLFKQLFGVPVSAQEPEHPAVLFETPILQRGSAPGDVESAFEYTPTAEQNVLLARAKAEGKVLAIRFVSADPAVDGDAIKIVFLALPAHSAQDRITVQQESHEEDFAELRGLVKRWHEVQAEVYEVMKTGKASADDAATGRTRVLEAEGLVIKAVVELLRPDKEGVVLGILKGPQIPALPWNDIETYIKANEPALLLRLAPPQKPPVKSRTTSAAQPAQSSRIDQILDRAAQPRSLADKILDGIYARPLAAGISQAPEASELSMEDIDALADRYVNEIEPDNLKAAIIVELSSVDTNGLLRLANSASFMTVLRDRAAKESAGEALTSPTSATSFVQRIDRAQGSRYFRIAWYTFVAALVAFIAVVSIKPFLRRHGRMSSAKTALFVGLLAVGLTVLGSSFHPQAVSSSSDLYSTSVIVPSTAGPWAPLLGFGVYAKFAVGIVGMALTGFRAWRATQRARAALTATLGSALSSARFWVESRTDAIFVLYNDNVLARTLRKPVQDKIAQLRIIAAA